MRGTLDLRAGGALAAGLALAAAPGFAAELEEAAHVVFQLPWQVDPRTERPGGSATFFPLLGLALLMAWLLWPGRRRRRRYREKPRRT